MDDYLSDKEQVERLRQWWRENGWFLLGGVALGLLGLYGYNQYFAYQDRQAEGAQVLYESVRQATDDSDTAASYGGAGSFMILILWLYYSTVILFFGAEWAQVRARIMGSQFQPAAHANRLVVEARDANDPEARSKIANQSASERMSGYTRDRTPSR